MKKEKIEITKWNYISWVFLAFALWLWYVLPGDNYKTDTTALPTKKESTLTMEQAIKVLDDKNTSNPTNDTTAEENARPVTFMETKREAIKKVLINHYQMKIRKNYLCEHNTTCTDDLLIQTSKEDEYKDIHIRFGYKSIEAFTNQHVAPIDYITVCTAIMIGVTDANENLIENTIVQSFSDAVKNKLGVKGNILGIEVSIIPDYRGLLGCKFYKY